MRDGQIKAAQRFSFLKRKAALFRSENLAERQSLSFQANKLLLTNAQMIKRLVDEELARAMMPRVTDTSG